MNSFAKTGVVATGATFAVLRILVAPLFALLYLVCIVLSPPGSRRGALIAATATATVVTAYGAALWLMPLFSQP